MNEQKHNFLSPLSQVLVLFLMVLTVFVGVKIVNEYRQGKYIGQDIARTRTITVSASGENFVKPNLALTSFSVITEKKTVNEALKESSEKMNEIIEFIKEQGVEEKDIKTTSFNIYPRYEYRKTIGIPEIYPIYPEGQRILVGYEVSQSLQVKIRDLEKIGTIIEGAANKGANQIGSLSFTLDPKEQDAAKNKARAEAIDEAKAKAKVLASQLGVSLIRITSFYESGGYSRSYELDQAAGMGGGGGESGITPQIETGENMITVTVNITYEID